MSAAHTWVGLGDLDIPQQIGIYPALRSRPAGAGTPVDGPQPHDAHQSLHRFRLTTIPPRSNQALMRRDPKKGVLQVLPVHGLHQGQVLFRGSPGPVVQAGPGSLPAGRTGASWTMMGAPGPPSFAAAPSSWTGPLGQEIPLHLELADLLVQAGGQRGVAPGFRS